jgi:nitrogen-specific signal transduction histidine kinase
VDDRWDTRKNNVVDTTIQSKNHALETVPRQIHKVLEKLVALARNPASQR